jgi:RNase P/RNase MRP subunit POP5
VDPVDTATVFIVVPGVAAVSAGIIRFAARLIAYEVAAEAELQTDELIAAHRAVWAAMA